MLESPNVSEESVEAVAGHLTTDEETLFAREACC